MPDRLDPAFVRAQIAALRAACPDIDDDEQLLSDMLEAETGLHEFLTRVVDVIDDTKELIAGIDIKMNERKARKARLEQRYQAMRELARKLMDAAGVRKVVLPLATLSIRAGQSHVIITDETALPPDCIKHEPNITAIRNRIKNGETVPGAEMSNREDTLSIHID